MTPRVIYSEPAYRIVEVPSQSTGEPPDLEYVVEKKCRDSFGEECWFDTFRAKRRGVALSSGAYALWCVCRELSKMQEVQRKRLEPQMPSRRKHAPF